MLFVADLHYALKQFDWVAAEAGAYDAVVIGGDLLDLGSALDRDVQIVVLEKYFERLRELTCVAVSSGNHDGDGRDGAEESVARWLREVKAPGLFVDGDSFELGETLVTVCPWWDGPESRAALEAQLERDAARRKGMWIWIHHSPPDGSPVSWTGRRFGGDEFLAGWIRKHEPDLVLSGHIHNAPFYEGGSWVDRIGRTWIFNPGRQIGPRPAHLSFDLTRMTVRWVSMEGEESRELGTGATAAVSAGVVGAA